MTHSLVANPDMNEYKLSRNLLKYLRRCGLSEGKLARCNAGTRLYHDLGIYGDEAEAYMGVLAEEYHVDLTGFEFEKYFPLEFPGRNAITRLLFWLAPFTGHAARRRAAYLPVTMEIIDRALLTKKWNAPSTSL